MKNGFRKRASQKPVEVEIEIKNATADSIARAQAGVDQATEQLHIANSHLNATLSSILTERGIDQARPLRVTDTKPRRLVVEVIKYAKPEKL